MEDIQAWHKTTQQDFQEDRRWDNLIFFRDYG